MKVYYFALLTALVWGIAPILEKLGLSKIQPLSALLIRSLGIAIGALLLIIFRSQTLKGALAADGRTFVYLLLGGILASFLGQIFFYHALKSGQISQVVPLAACYPLVAFFIAVLFLHEQVTIQKAIGIICVISGVLLLK